VGDIQNHNMTCNNPYHLPVVTEEIALVVKY